MCSSNLPDLAYELLSAKIYLRERSMEVAKMERKYNLEGFYRKNWRKNTRKEEARLRLLMWRIGAEKLTVGFLRRRVSLGRGVRLLLRLLRWQRAAMRCGGAMFCPGRALRAGRGERAKEAKCGTVREKGTARGPIYRLGRPVHVAD